MLTHLCPALITCVLKVDTSIGESVEAVVDSAVFWTVWKSSGVKLAVFWAVWESLVAPVMADVETSW
jgi:hypothetical protein